VNHRHLTQVGLWITTGAALAADQDALGIIAGVGVIAYMAADRIMANTVRARNSLAAELAKHSDRLERHSAESRAILGEVRRVARIATTASRASTATLELKRAELEMFDSQPPNAWSGSFKPQP